MGGTGTISVSGGGGGGGGTGGCGTGGATGGATGGEGEAGSGGGGGVVTGLGTGMRRRATGAPLFTGPGSCRRRGRGTGSPLSLSRTRPAGSAGSADAIRTRRATRGAGLESWTRAGTARRGTLGAMRACRAGVVLIAVGPRSAAMTGNAAGTSTTLFRESFESSARAEMGSGSPTLWTRKKTPMTAPVGRPTLRAAFNTRRIPRSSVPGAEGQSLARVSTSVGAPATAPARRPP
jgi:hypothetical protein